MAKLLFWDVDTQVDFIEPDGKLYVPEAETLKGNLARLTEAARENALPVVASADDHELGDEEISDEPDFSDTYPPHCMRGTAGVERIAETRWPEAVEIGHEPLTDEEVAARLSAEPPVVLIHKKRFDVFTNPNTEKILAALEPERVVVYGVALDVCNRFAVEGLLDRGYRNLTVVTDATKAIEPEDGEWLLLDWRRRGVELLTTDEVLQQLPGPLVN